ncbi:hypothetical protein V1511DRAFT_85481 [Dipodascopsis uninucleata]
MAKRRLQALLAHFSEMSVPVEKSKPHIHELNPAYFLQRAAELEPNAVAIVHKDRSGRSLERSYLTEAEFSRRIASYLKVKYTKGAKIGVVSCNSPMFLECIFGIAGSGLIQATFNYRLSADEIRRVFELSQISALFVDRDFLELVLEALKNSSLSDRVEIIVNLDSDQSEDIEEFRKSYTYQTYNELIQSMATDKTQFSALHFQDLPEDDIIALAFTSGTTGMPKAVEYTHRGMYLASMGAIIESELNRVDRRCRYLWTLPMFHAGAWAFPYAVTAVRGTHVCLRKMDYDLIWQYLTNITNPVTHYCAAPTVNTAICDHPMATKLSHPVIATVAAAPPSPALFRQMYNLNIMPVHVYGMTETYGPITRCYYREEWKNEPDESRFQKLSRQGQGFIASKKLRVITLQDSLDGSLIDVKSDGKEIGEIVFQGNICMKGYHNDPGSTANAFRGGWLHSGDLAVVHPDGMIQIVDRSKDIIISGGENISSVAIENVLQEHPAVLECAVIGIRDDKFGERPKAFVVLRRGHDSREQNESAIKNDLLQLVKTKLGGYQVPKEVEIIKSFPKTSTGKIKKAELKRNL